MTRHVTLEHLRARICSGNYSQATVARESGYQPSAFSRYLSGRRRLPPGFVVHVAAVLDRLDRADRAAHAARQHVLSEAETR